MAITKNHNGHNPRNNCCDSNFGKLHVLKWFTNVYEPHIGEERGMQKVHWGWEDGVKGL